MDAEAVKAIPTEYLTRHQAKDSQGVAALFAEDAKVWDPVDGEPCVGRAAIAEFFASTHQMAERMEFTLTGPIRVAGLNLAFPFQVDSYLPGMALRLQIIDTMLIGEDGLIQEMKAYWSFADAVPLEQEA
jgi:steroid delta-isomerase